MFPTFVTPSSAGVIIFSVTTSSFPVSDTVVTSFSPFTGALSTTFSSKFRLSSASYFTSAGIVSFVTLVVLAMSSIVPAGIVVFFVVVGFVNSPVFGSTS